MELQILCAAPDLTGELQIAVCSTALDVARGAPERRCSAGPHPAEDMSKDMPEDMSIEMSDSMSEKNAIKNVRKNVRKECQKEC